MNQEFKMRYSDSELTEKEVKGLSKEDWIKLYNWEKKRSDFVNKETIGFLTKIVLVVMGLMIFIASLLLWRVF